MIKKPKPCGTCPISTLCIGNSIEGAANKHLLLCKTCREVFLYADRCAYWENGRPQRKSIQGRFLAQPRHLCKEMVEHLDTRQGGFAHFRCEQCKRESLERTAKNYSEALNEHNYQQRIIKESIKQWKK